MTFEESIKELDAIVEKLESGKMSIDDSLDLYSKGMKLCVQCNQKLTEVKGKIALLEQNSEGFIEKPVEVE